MSVVLDDLILELETSIKTYEHQISSRSTEAKNEQLLNGSTVTFDNKNSNVKSSNNKTKNNNKDNNKDNSKVNIDEDLTINSIDLRVGVIRSVTRHATADKLYCEEIDVGEETFRPIASGLVPYYSLEQMMGRKLIVVCNLKPRNLVGFKSQGMVYSIIRL